jgi:hypothetical protein
LRAPAAGMHLSGDPRLSPTMPGVVPETPDASRGGPASPGEARELPRRMPQFLEFWQRSMSASPRGQGIAGGKRGRRSAALKSQCIDRGMPTLPASWCSWVSGWRAVCIRPAAVLQSPAAETSPSAQAAGRSSRELPQAPISPTFRAGSDHSVGPVRRPSASLRGVLALISRSIDPSTPNPPKLTNNLHESV